MSAATKIREDENAEYVKVNADYNESFDAISRALVVLKNKDASIDEALLQKATAFQSPKELVAFLQTAMPEGPQAKTYAYDGQSGE